MIKLTDYMGDVVELEVQITKYLEGGCLAVVLINPTNGELYTVLSRNIEEAIPFMSDNQTLIPQADEGEFKHEAVKQLIQQGVLTPTDVKFPYNFYTMELFEVCIEKADSVNFNEQ